MDDKNHKGDHGGATAAGLIYKAAQLASHEVTDEDLKLINKHTLEPLAADDVFTFKAVLCDNELDRHFEHFTLKALTELKKLFLGKTVIKDHMHKADNQVARIYKTEIVQSESMTKSGGELYAQLVAHCYMVKTESNKDLIAEIKGGIKKEGSVGCSITSSICSICGTDNAKNYCRHWPGKSYDKEGGKQVCTFKLDGAKDAYEFSLVAVPAQRAAGTCKSYTGETVYASADDLAAEPETDQADPADDQTEKAQELALRAKLAATKSKIKNL